MNSWLLGSGGGIPTHERATCSALLREGPHALLIDAGTGVSHLVTNPQLVDGVETVDVILTHFHLDHLFGLPFLPSLGLPSLASIHGPGRSLYGDDTRALLTRLLGRPFLSDGWGLSAIAGNIFELEEGEIEIGPFAVAIRVQQLHGDPTLAFRINDSLGYCTDTAYDAANVAFVRGCHTLAHEAWYTEDAPSGVGSHSSAAEAAGVARDAGVSNLVLIHIGPTADESALAQEARAVFPSSVVGTDLMPLIGNPPQST